MALKRQETTGNGFNWRLIARPFPRFTPFAGLREPLPSHHRPPRNLPPSRNCGHFSVLPLMCANCGTRRFTWSSAALATITDTSANALLMELDQTGSEESLDLIGLSFPRLAGGLNIADGTGWAGCVTFGKNRKNRKNLKYETNRIAELRVKTHVKNRKNLGRKETTLN